MNDKSAGISPLIAVALLLPIAAYFGGYVALVDRDEPLRICEDGRCRPRLYRYGGTTAEYLFAPARWVDERVRPDEDADL